MALSPTTNLGSHLRLGAPAPGLARGFRPALPTRESTQVGSRDVEGHLGMTWRVAQGCVDGAIVGKPWDWSFIRILDKRLVCD